MKSFNSKNQKGLKNNRTLSEHSTFNNHQSSIMRVALMLLLALSVSGNVWGATWWGEAYAYSSPSQTGWIWITIKGTKFEGTFEEDISDSSKDSKYNWSSSADFTAQYYAKPKDGYKFVGWFDNAAGTGTNYSSSTTDNCSYSIGFTSKSKSESSPASVTRYARFEGIPYTVKFYGNGYTGGEMADQSFTYGTAQNLSANAYKRTYTVTYSPGDGGTVSGSSTATATYNFKCWNTQADGSGTNYNNQVDGCKLTTTGSTVNLHAQWTSANVTLPNATKANHSLEGWYDGSTRVGGYNDKYTPTANVTLTAHWALSKLTVELNPGEGSVSPSSMEVTYGGQYGTLPTPTDDDKLFEGWFTAASGGTQVYSTTMVTATTNHTLYAHWATVKTYVLGYVTNKDKHVGGNIYISSGDVTDISKVTNWKVNDYGGPNNGKSHKYYFFAKADLGYDFTKWTNANGGQESTSTTFTPTVTVNTIAEGSPNPKTVEYYAIFTVHKWTLGWAGFTSSEATTSYTDAGTKDYGSAITAPTLRRYGYIHNGWSPTFQNTMPDNDVTYTAQWAGVTISGATAQTKNFTAQTQTQTAALTFPVTNATDKNDFYAPTLSGDAGWTISSWNYASNNVTVNLSFTATENTTTSGNHVTTVTLKAKNNVSASGQVTASVNMTPAVTNKIKDSYYVEDANINLNTAWESTSNGTKHYQLVSFTPASGEQSGSTTPTLTNNILTLGKAGSVVIKFWQDAGTSSRAIAETTKTITINRITNTLTADATHSMYVGDTWNNVYSNKNSNATITTTTSASTWAYFNVSDNKIVAQNTTNAGDDSKSVTIKIEQAETYKYTSVSKSIAVTVNKKTPSVSWTSQTYYMNNSYSNVFTFTGDASLFSSSSSDGTVAAMTGLTSMQTFNKSAATTITVTATENYMWKGGTFTTSITPIKISNHVSFVYDKSWYDNYTTKDGDYSWVAKSTVADSYLQLGKDEFSLYGFEGTAIFHFEGYPEKISFQVSTSTSISQTPSRKMYESTNGTDWGEAIWSYDWTATDWSETQTTNLKPTTRYIKFTYDGLRAGQIRYITVSELQYFKTDISSISYDPVTIGSTAPIKSFKVQHCNAGYQTSVVAPAHFQVSTNQSDWSSEVVISTNATAVTGGDKMDEKTVYVKYLADAVGNHSGSIQVKNNLLADQTVSVSGSTVKMVPPITWLIADQIANGEEIAKSDIATTESVLAIDFTSSNTDVAYFEDGMLIAQAAGTTTITATITGNDFYADRVETKGITVTNKTIQTITWNQNFDMKPTGSAREKLTATASSGLAVEYSTDDSNVASITKEGNDYYVNFKDVGQTNIYANQAGDGTYAAASTKTKFVMIYDASQPCPSEYKLHTEKTDIKDDYEEYDVKIPQSFYFETHANSGASQNFYVKQYVNGGWQTIYDEFISSGDYRNVTLTAANGLSENATKIRYGTNANRGYKVQNVKYTQKTSTSCDKSSLTFSAFPSSPTVAQTIKVTNYNRMILVTTNDANFVVSPAQLGACGSKTETDLSVYYNAPATEGTYPAKLYLKDNTGVTMQTIDLSATVDKLSQTVAFSDLGSAYSTTDKVTLAATSNKAAEKERNFTYSVVSTNGVASITSNTLTFLKSGTATIRVTEAGDNMYNSAYAEASITVNKVTPDIVTDLTATTINYGSPLSASTLSGGKATVTLRGTADVEVKGNWAWHEPTAVKTANGGIAQTYQADFTPEDDGMYNPTTRQVSVLINQVAQTINWNQTIGDQVYNGSLTLTASSGTSGGGAISYTWSPDLATISGSTLTFNKGVGSITVTAHAASNANYIEATTSKSFNILRINSTITKKDISDTYLVDAEKIDLQSLWTTDGDGVVTYSKVSFSPSSTINGTATEPYIENNQYLYFGQAGTLVIKLSMAEGSHYNAITDEKTIKINKRTPNIGFVTNTYYFNSTYPSVYTVTDGDATLCTLTSSDQDVAVVESTGIKTYNKPASTKLTLTSAENYKWAKKTIETTITPTADPNVPALYYTEAFFNHPGVTVAKTGTPSWTTTGHDANGKLVMACSTCEDYRSTVDIRFKGNPNKITYDYSNSGTQAKGTFAVYAGTSASDLTLVGDKHTPADNNWYSAAKSLNSNVNYIQWAFANNPVSGDFSAMKIYGNAYIMATDESSLSYGVKVKNDVETKQISFAHANIGYNSTISSDNAQFVVSADGTNFASSQTISTKDSKVTGGGIQGIKKLYIKYLASAEGVHNATITITDENSHSITVSVSGETQGKLNTKAIWTGDSSCPIGEIANAFVVTDDNDNSVSGSWALTSKDESIFQIQGENIVAVCGGTATIDGVFTPNASATYKNCTTSVSLTAVRNANPISWARYEDGKNDIHFLADDQKWISDAAEAKTAITYEPGDSWTDGVIIFNDDYTAFKPGKVGTVTINANAEEECKWASSTSSHTIIIDYNDQTIFWNQNLIGFVTNEQGKIDQWVDLEAVAMDKDLNLTGVEIQYAIDAGGESVAVVSGTRLHIVGIGNTYITATTVASDKYKPISTRREIKVRQLGAKCDSYVLYEPSELTFYTGKKEQYEISGPVNIISFNYKRNDYIASGGTIMTINLLDANSATLKQIFQKNYSDMGTSEASFDLDISSYTTAKYLEIQCTNGKYESNEIYISNLTISQKSYFTADETPISANVAVNDSVKRDITLYYSDVPIVQYSITNNNKLGFTLTPDRTPDNDCGQVGSYTFKLSGICTKEVNGAEETITLSTSAGNEIKIPVTITATLGDTYTFLNGAGDSIWENKANWKTGESTPTELPGASNAVTIKNRMVISSQVECYSLSLVDNAAITIMPTGGLTVHAGGVDGLNSNNFRIKSTTSSQGYFRLSPDVPNATTAMPTATVEYATKSDVGAGNKKAVWQYFGVPTADKYSFYVDYITWVCRWDEKTVGWIPLPQLESSDLEPFHGYIITGYDNQIRDFAGQLYNGDKDITLTYTYTGEDGSGDGMWGDNVIANSYAAPIDVTKFTNDDFEGTSKFERVFYLFISGSYEDWEKYSTSTYSNPSPGQYLALPALSSKDLGTTTTIAPMQGIYMHNGGSTSAKVKFNYRKHVWAATGDMNRPMDAPERDIASVDPDTLRQRVRLSLVNKESGSDILYLIEREKYSPEYENGYDANKMIMNGLVNIYTNEQAGNMAVSAINDIDSMYVGFTNGAGDTLTMYASLIVGEPMYLLDTHTETRTLLTEGASYTFTAEPNTRDDFRFMLLKQSHSGDDPIYTGWINKEAAPDAHIWNTRDMLYVTEAGAHSHLYLYSMNGQLIDSQSFSDHTSMSIVSLPKGCYMARVGRTIYKFVR